jgi:uncharacterized protein (TIGR03435 family)
MATFFAKSEGAARLRLHRAMEKLRQFFSKRGVNSTAEAIAGAISAYSVQVAPTMLAKSVMAVAASKGAAASGSTSTLIKGAGKIMAWTKAKIAITAGIGILIAAGTATVTVQEIEAHEPPAWQKKFDLSLLDGLPPQVQILPSLPSTKENRGGGRNGKTLCLGQRFMAVLEGAYNAVQSRFIINSPLPEGKFDFIIVSPGTKENLEGLQDEVKKKFRLAIQREVIETNIFILTVNYPIAAGFHPSRHAFVDHVESAAYSIRGATLDTLVADLEESLGTVVIDETKLGGEFDIDLTWDGTPDGLKRVLRDERGLELTPSRRPVEFIAVDSAGGADQTTEQD